MTNHRRNGNSHPSEGEDREPDMIDHALFAVAMTAANTYALGREGLRLVRKEVFHLSNGIRVRLGAKPAPDAESIDA
ncbi:MAG: hypothetical protein US89_C0007G0050 [Candidatus Peregrinibacteria bacterium GW2011_GWF2_38_29]|nr:MAG: hypothetical protein US89_C0007G0050 [Candidatus Peregrinibacteria bacterium GW2011_GWF2_38_29]HBB02865.1 hypothetical protein [Candidatus Peregrinibacteria bacterium]